MEFKFVKQGIKRILFDRDSNRSQLNGVSITNAISICAAQKSLESAANLKLHRFEFEFKLLLQRNILKKIPFDGHFFDSAPDNLFALSKLTKFSAIKNKNKTII